LLANQYGLSPWTKEIYAFPDKNNGIVPVVGVDGWARIINGNDQFDGMEFEQDDESCTCKIYRKDRSRPTCVTEYMSECKRNGVGPWQSHPKRMLRHKAMIQCARLAFGFGGIYDQDEAERIVEKDITPAPQQPAQPQALPAYPDEQFNKNISAWGKAVQSGAKTAADVINTVSSKYTLSPTQQARINALEEPAPIEGEARQVDDFLQEMAAEEAQQ